MTIKRIVNGYEVDLRPDGRNGKRIRKKFDSKAEAVRFENHIMMLKHAGKEWNPSIERRSLNDLIDTWFAAHGNALQGGVRQKHELNRISIGMGNPLARNVDAKMWGEYRVSRISGDKGVSAKTVNNEQTYLKAMFNELKRLGEWESQNPIEGIRPLKHIQPEMSFLSDIDIKVLFEELKKSKNTDVVQVTEICLRTGARWSEAEKLRSSQLVKGSPCKIVFEKTKGNKRRSVPIDSEFFDSLPKKSGRLFDYCWGAFRGAAIRAKLDLADGQMTHSLRHTFASEFMRKGGNIIVLKDILGHSSLNDTIKYAHFAPHHLEDAIRFNPLVK